MKLQGKTAVVTGGANGIGAAIVRRFLAEGADVAIVDWVKADLAAFSGEGAKGRVSFHQCDVSDGAAIEQAGAEVLAALGRVDILVNNAGGSGKVPAVTVEENSDEIWHYVMDLNVTSIIRFCRLFVPGMRAARHGRIINMSSLVRHGIPGPASTMRSHLAYVTAKGAMVSLSSQLANDLGRDGITCNAIAPGMILPDPEARVTKIILSQPQEMQDYILGTIPLGRYGNGPDIAAMAAFLASDEGEFVSGQTIDVSGGA